MSAALATLQQRHRRRRLVVDRGFERPRYRCRPDPDPDSNPHQAGLKRLARDLERWKRSGVRMRTDRASTTTLVGMCLGETFRLVDGHGKSVGPRYESTRKIKPGTDSRYHSEYAQDLHQVRDPKGNLSWLPTNTRCRLVDRQPEDYHSYICRALKAAHRKGVES